MNNLYNHLSEKKFKILTIICCILADLCSGAFVYYRMSDETTFKESVTISYKFAQQFNPQLQGVELAAIYGELWQLFLTMLMTIILVAIAIHALVYIAHYHDKSFAYSYTKLYAWVGGVLMTLFAITNLFVLPMGLFAIPGLLLLFVAYGTKFFPFKNTEE